MARWNAECTPTSVEATCLGCGGSMHELEVGAEWRSRGVTYLCWHCAIGKLQPVGALLADALLDKMARHEVRGVAGRWGQELLANLEREFWRALALGLERLPVKEAKTNGDDA